MILANRVIPFLLLPLCFSLLPPLSHAQVKWQNVDSLFQPLPASVHVYKTTGPLDGKPCIAYYVDADLKDKKLQFTVDTTLNRRLKPSQFYEKNHQPLLVVNTTFFSFATNQNLNVVVKDGKQVAYNIHTIPGRGKDTLTYRHPFGSAIGISKKRKADIAWTFTDSAQKHVLASQSSRSAIQDSFPGIVFSPKKMKYTQRLHPRQKDFKRLFSAWKVKTAVGGGPVLLQNGEIRITNNEEMKFAGKAIEDKHPRTAMGYTRDNKLIILVIEGRNPGLAEGATLAQEAAILKELGCKEALNLDGGGSTCMLVNGITTIKPADKEGQRPVPAVFIVKAR